MSDLEPKAVAENDIRKLHAEVTQIVQQRFYLTTIAIVSFGTISGWATSPLVSGKSIAPGFAWIVEGFLIFVLLGLYLYSTLLLGMMRILTTYINEKYDSPWEKEWLEFRHQNGSGRYKGYSEAITFVFQILGVLSLGLFAFLLYLGNRGEFTWLWILPLLVIVGLFEGLIAVITKWRHRIYPEADLKVQWKVAIERAYRPEEPACSIETNPEARIANESEPSAKS
jgi:hypothetical protein